MCVWSKPGGYHFTFFILFSLVCQNAVCKFCTCRQSFRYCSFIPQLKKVHLFASPPNLQKYFGKFSSAFSEHFFHFFIPKHYITSCSKWNSLYQFLYVCGVPSHLFDAIDKMDSFTLPAVAALFMYAAEAKSALQDTDNNLKQMSEDQGL